MRNLLAIAACLSMLSCVADAADAPLPDDIIQHVTDECKSYGVSASLVLAVIKIESGFDPDAFNKSSGCIGLMQIHTGNASWLLRDADADIYTPEGNITAGVYILSQGLERYGDAHRALMAYNCGDGRARELWDGGTRSTAYSRRVMVAAAEYEGYDVQMPRLCKPLIGGLLQ